MNESNMMRRRIDVNDELSFIQTNRNRLQTHFLTPAKFKWAKQWGHSRSEFEEIVASVLSMDQGQIQTLREENRKHDPLKGKRETQIQLLHSIDLFITGVLKFPEE